ncbi:hypothetical protein J7T55_004493 [Diaporthe amygdali]|uniref:uncharacterized protein n=1 Tax=Phomopsis amygdali TaxID=1214568 RepID=UPI0022FDDDB8|nr:uncharacterized protein J7T55_004493 [Diaporthe amygdali]KAJ0114752.1 hypothetical protein J7T55_004493 [Diaporthe amygdali]
MPRGYKRAVVGVSHPTPHISLATATPDLPVFPSALPRYMACHSKSARVSRTLAPHGVQSSQFTDGRQVLEKHFPSALFGDRTPIRMPKGLGHRSGCGGARFSDIRSLSTINRVEFFFADPGLFDNSIASLAQEMTSTRQEQSEVSDVQSDSSFDQNEDDQSDESVTDESESESYR